MGHKYVCLKSRTEAQEEIAVHLSIKGLIRKIEKIKTEEGSVAMCRAVKEWLEDERNQGRREGIREGKKEGIEEGKKEEKQQIIKRMQAEGLEENLIRRITKCTKAELAATRL